MTTIDGNPIHLFVLDGNLQNLHALLGELPAGAVAITLNGDEDGWTQVLQALKGLRDCRVEVLHIVSHAEAGRLRLGDAWETTQSLSERVGTLTEIGSLLEDDADVLLYGCSLAADAAGQQFVSTLALALGADVAASTDATGPQALGGDWILEFERGQVQARVLELQQLGYTLGTFIGTPGPETLLGTAGDDTINGLAGNDWIDGSAGNDNIAGSEGADTLLGGDGDDRLIGATSEQPNPLTGDLGDSLVGGSGNDVLRGNFGDDTLIAGEGDDNLRGDQGNDVLDGGPGRDVASYFYSPLNLPYGVHLDVSQAVGDGERLVDDQLGGIDTLILIDYILSTTTDHRDTIIGSSGSDLFNGMGGDDWIDGGFGADEITGGDGDDSLDGGLGGDRFLLGRDSGSDTIDGGGYITRNPWQSFLTVPNNGDDYDRLYYSTALDGIQLDLSARTVEVTGLDGVDHYTNVEEVIGTTHSDTVIGKPSEGSSFFFWGLGGSDVITQTPYGIGSRWADGLIVSYSWSETPITVEWTGNQALVSYGAGTGSITGAGPYAAGTDTLTNILYIQTSAKDDIINATGATLNHFGYLTNSVDRISYFVVAVRGGDDVIRGSGNFLLIPEVNTSSSAVPADGKGITVDGRTLGDDGLLVLDMTHLKTPASSSTAHGTVRFSGVSNVYGTNWNDTFYAGNGINDFRGQGGNDTLYGNEYLNTASYRSSTNGISVQLAQGVVTDRPGGNSSGTDTLRGVEYIEGTRFDDVFDARGFSRSSVNAGGEQSYWMGMTNAYTPLGGNDTVIGNGLTRLAFTSAMMGIEANLAEGFVDALATDVVTRASPEYLYTVGRTTFTGVFAVGGTDYADMLIGSSGGAPIGNLLGESFDPRAGADTVKGQGGFDVVGYSSSPSAVQVDLTLASGQVVEDGWGSSDTLIDIDRVEGSQWSDRFLGDDGDNSFRGLRGSDSIDGGAGRDRVDFQSRRLDTSTGVIVDLGGTAERAESMLQARPASLPAGYPAWARDNWGDTDFLKNIEDVNGSDWDDVLIGSDGDNRLDGIEGADTLVGAGGTDWVEYNGAEAGVTVDLGAGRASNDGFGFEDVLIGLENVLGSIFADRLAGSVEPNVLDGEAGDDSLQGWAGDDTLTGGAGDDDLDGGFGSDTAVFTGARSEYAVRLDAASGVVTVTDQVAGRDGSDTLAAVERLQFADGVIDSPWSAMALQGLAYHWKSHALLSGVEVSALEAAAVRADAGALLDLRGARFDPATRALTVEVWADAGPSSTMENFGFTARAAGALSGQFTAALPGADPSWLVTVNTDQPGTVRVGGISLAGAQGPLKLGVLQMILPTQADPVRLELADVIVNTTEGPVQGLQVARSSSGADGQFAFTSFSAGAVQLTARRAATDSGNAVNSADAIAALKIAVGFNPNADPDGAGPKTASAVLPYQILAADANQDGKVNSADALTILRMSVQLSTAPAPQWLFVEETRDFWDEAKGQFTLSAANAVWDTGIEAPSPGTANLVGVLTGDVNGSWTPPAGSADLDVLDPGHFERLAELVGVPVEQFGIDPGP